MTKTLTLPVNFETLRSRGSGAATVVKLMMACNDMTLANEALGNWTREQPRLRKARQAGARMYFVRTQLSHLHEALKIIRELLEDSTLQAVLTRCPEPTHVALGQLEAVLPGGDRQAWFNRIVGQVRHNLTFHYHQCNKLILNAISDRAGREEGRISSITRADSAHLCHYRVADHVVDSIVVREIWKIPREVELRAEADKVAGETDDLVRAFLNFAGNFIWTYFSDDPK